MKKWLAGIGAVVIAGGLTLAVVSGEDGEKKETTQAKDTETTEVANVESGADTDSSANSENKEEVEKLPADASTIKSEMTEFIHKEIQAEGRNNRESVIGIEVADGTVTYKILAGPDTPQIKKRVNSWLDRNKKLFAQTFENYAVDNVRIEWINSFGIDSVDDLALGMSLTKADYEAGVIDGISFDQFPEVTDNYTEHEIYKTYSK
ncbi:hypothetical protein [Halobacillus naozhouensis]|uniref:Uncharacterized protein n=1 Tax=Halobacillus naozhouensis TaxID=554880 RepID=A0ABY8IXE5_9BACI|nr:hypothetical protein [Halobacillus naozhouensis]WFT74898.1 hypothetical protein P9989_00210 [Halobacillus naozhouensis]